MSWFANIVNFLVTGNMPAQWSSQDKKKFLSEVKHFYWDDPYLFKYCPDQIMRRCIPDNEVSSVIKFFHSDTHSHHFSLKKDSCKNLAMWILLACFVQKWILFVKHAKTVKN